MQETRWKGGSARNIVCDDGWHKFYWVGCEDGMAGVGGLVAERWINTKQCIVEVRRVSEIGNRKVGAKCCLSVCSSGR